MVNRIRHRLPLTCDCGAKGWLVSEEDDVPERMEGAVNYAVVRVEGPFRQDGTRFICIHCGK